ncbi:26S proteasome regulatory subunit S1 [Dictyostelium purpureum]|uniref:26S proteasome regulatory subunit S1 n=1 Tax=Dictyostelium purpureum TaxID=5786 RepID=F0ZIG0_DICPU|nr:26S proteasome regulatory subunit S1 [Dictyostelium purpureum]EGC36277.1 26S proteasome regulatory subunit S1 [Dictyostelium purpureum]|eukprot:XP_003287223.1 26S proteasome regulatory subunit S1 [Dictyostelium purpureum]
MAVVSVSNYLSLLDEDQTELKSFSLEKLDTLVDEFWAEIASNSIDKIKKLSQNKQFPKHELASLVLSKVYYNLSDFRNSMEFALQSGSLFNVLSKSEYVETLLYKFIDEYIKLRNLSEKEPINSHLESIVMGMFDRCFKEGSYKQALGIAIEARRLDIIEKCISESGNVPSMLSYCLHICNSSVGNRHFRHSVLGILVNLHLAQEKPDYLNVIQCLIFLDNHIQVATILLSLIKKDEDSLLLAYQIGFDLFQNSTQQFLLNVRERLPQVDKKSTESKSSDSMDIDIDSGNTGDKQEKERLEKLHLILQGDISIGMNLEFLYRNCSTDMNILQSMKATSELHKGAIFYSGTLFANALMHAGTTRDSFLRSNLEWLYKSTHWTKFSAISSLGVINKGHIKESKTLLKTYLPGASVNATPYSESGALYALGLIHASHGEEIIDYLQEKLHINNAILHHGASLGLGLAAMASGRDDLYEDLKTILYNDDAISGEASGLAMGLVMLGSGSQKAIEEMLAYAHETQHEKTIRSLAMGLAFLMYGKEESADVLIEQMMSDKDPLLRYGGMYTVAMAYCGTGNNDALRKLLSVAVSDGNDSVRRAAVTCIGFVLSRQPEKCPKTIALLAESYNPHVRYGAAFALGIACAGTGQKDALDILKTLTTDTVGYVKQAAWISMAMVLIQTSKELVPEAESARKLFNTCISDKREDSMSKFGAVLAFGVIDAGGRNCNIQLHSPSGHKNMNTIVGIAGFLQFWYWFPMTHFMGLALTPTSIIGLNKNLEMPVFSFKSNCKPSYFSYPPESKASTQSQTKNIETVILSYSRKTKLQSSRSAMNIDQEMKEQKEKEEKEQKEKEDKEQKEKEEKEKEPVSERKQNPARVVPKQLQFVVFDDSRYQPIKKNPAIGIVMLKDLTPDVPEELVTKEKPEPKPDVGQQSGTHPSSSASNNTNNTSSSLPEPSTPEPFEFTE